MDSRIETGTTTENHGLSTEKILAQLKTMIQQAEEKAVERAKAADRLVRDHPYQSVGLAFGVGLLIGLLVRRK